MKDHKSKVKVTVASSRPHVLPWPWEVKGQCHGDFNVTLYKCINGQIW